MQLHICTGLTAPHHFCFLSLCVLPLILPTMAPMKAAAVAMSKSALAEAIATHCELKKSVAMKALATLAEVATKEVKKAGVFAIPGLCRIKTRNKPATKATKKMMFGKLSVVKAKPAKTVVKAFVASAFKSQF